MTDYAAAPIQPIAEALLIIDAAGNPQLVGHGFSSVVRVLPGPGRFRITFDEGVVPEDVGSGGLVNEPGFGYTDGRVGPNGVDPNKLRVALTMRSGTTAPGSTTLADLNASVSVTPQGIQIDVAIANFLDAPTDPMGAGAPNANGGGLEIIAFYGNATADNFSQQLVGPNYQPVLQFP